MDNSEDESYNELDSSQQLDCMKSNTMFHRDNQILLTMRSSKSTSVSMIEPTGITSTITFLQGFFLQYLHKVVNTVMSVQTSLQVSLHDNILHHLYKGISMVVSLLSSLLASLRSKLLRSSLLTSLRSEFLRLFLHTSLRSDFYNHV